MIKGEVFLLLPLIEEGVCGREGDPFHIDRKNDTHVTQKDCWSGLDEPTLPGRLDGNGLQYFQLDEGGRGGEE